MNEKSSPSNRAPLKSYAHSEDAPRGEWFLISNAKGGLYGYRWHEDGSPDLYISRRITEGREEHEFDEIPTRVLGCLDDTEDMAIKLECHASPIRITYKELLVLHAFMREEAMSLDELSASYVEKCLAALEGGQTV